MTAETKVKEPLQEELERLEMALDTPPVPGEMTSWASMIRKNFDAASKAILSEIDSGHREKLREIEGQDAELLARTQQLRDDDKGHKEWCRQLGETIAAFEANAARAGADEKQVLEQQQALVEEGLRFVTHVRKQERALRSWLQEAFERDTGLGD